MTITDSETRSGRAIVVHPVLRGGEAPARTAAASLEEAVRLAEAIGLNVVEQRSLNVSKPTPATLMGQGTVDEIGRVLVAEPVAVAIVDHTLSPVQQRNLERAWSTKVIDRTGLILEIFGERAHTREGQLQVELAHLSYQRSRLVRSWTHLERQRGGGGGGGGRGGFLGGPGERQLELDRRMIDDRIVRLKRELEEVRRTRGLHREARSRVPYPVVALVGYTNAGKSTLFNQLTRAAVVARDMLFATLDPTMRATELGHGRRAIISDTVGFISDLPTHLIAAFRATLEEVENADIILHVRDAAHAESAAQKADVLTVLADLGIDQRDPRLIEVLNKTDLLPEAERAKLEGEARRDPAAVAISALTGAGRQELLDAIAARLEAGRKVVEVALDPGDGKTIAWLHAHGRVLERTEVDSVVRYRVSLEPADAARLERRLANAPAP